MNPSPNNPDWTGLPKQMRDLPQWVLRDGKIPLNPRTGRYAQGDNPRTWGPWSSVCNKENIGFELLNFIGIDFDHIWRYETNFCLESREYVKQIAPLTYCEYSLSLVGGHVFGLGDWIVPDDQKVFYDPDAPLVLVNKKLVPDVQVQFSTPYPGMVIDNRSKQERKGVINGRFYAITGKTIPDTVFTIGHITDIVADCYNHFKTKYGTISASKTPKQSRSYVDLPPIDPRIAPDKPLTERIACMRPEFRQLLVPHPNNEIHGLCRKTNHPEFLYWKGLFIEAQTCGILPQELYTILQQTQPAFDIPTTETQLKYHVKPTSRPFTDLKLQELFPREKPLPKHVTNTKSAINRNHFVINKFKRRHIK